MKQNWISGLTVLCMIVAGVAAGEAQSPLSPIVSWQITPTSLVSRDDPPRQRIDLAIESAKSLKGITLRVFHGERLLAEKRIGPLSQGNNAVSVLLDEPKGAVETRWELSEGATTLAKTTLKWVPPRHWTLYVLKSAHVDIGLHDSQYKQRYMTDAFIDDSRRLADETAAWPDATRYRYVVEGLWWWFNYPQDRSERLADEIVNRYVKRGIVDIGASHSGNHTQVFGHEELCRSTYYARELRSRWDVPAETMLMIDNNGITWPLVTAYADAGIKNLIFLPNAWNPKTVGATRIEVGWASPLPHLFYWEGPDSASRLLVWANPHYIGTGRYFGIQTCQDRAGVVTTPEEVAPKMAKHLALLESSYPYDLWLVSNYDDNETPSLGFARLAKAWNAQWRWPELRTIGNLSEPFNEVRERFGDEIPTLRGDITGGWAQHPLSTPPLLAKKRAADRLLPVAEKLATLARLSDPDFVYPVLPLRRAWDALICNDEHGYGVSNYKGRPVYDTWMQKRDWIDRAMATAEQERTRALEALAALTPAESPSVFVFNPTLQARAETAQVELPESCADLHAARCPDGTIAPSVVDGNRLTFRTAEIPPMGYALFSLVPGNSGKLETRPASEPPVIENRFYRVSFDVNGTICGIFDKELQRELVDVAAPYRCNQFVYTRDAHKNLTSPSNARYQVETSLLGQSVVARMDDSVTGAAIEQRVTLPTFEKRIDIDNRLDHVRDLGSDDRWNRFGYYAFPFAVPDGHFRIGLNGCSARPGDDQTGHGSDAYMAARDWASVNNDRFGVTLVQYDSCLVECGKIHSYKNVVGEPLETSHLYSYVLNDWLYAHAYVTGPSHINLRYRYVIRSQAGKFQESHAAEFAERAMTPVEAIVICQPQKGTLPAGPHSFLSVDRPNVELLALKLSETPGRGVIVRLHETGGSATRGVHVNAAWGNNLTITRCSVTERDGDVLNGSTLDLAPFGYTTLRFEEPHAIPSFPDVKVDACSDKSVTLSWASVAGARQYHIYRGEDANFHPDEFHLIATTLRAEFTDDWLDAGKTYCYRVGSVAPNVSQRAVSEPVSAATAAEGDSPPAKVGVFHTGLISDPRAWRGDEPDVLYLQWGQNRESDLAHYELYRGDKPDFEPDETTFVAKIEPGPYVVVPYEDRGLKPHTTYYYRVRAVDKDGHKGQMSDLCPGTTREPNNKTGGD